ncbi:metalloprotease [Streptomyces sp. AP-93]|uniref:metalloprotease n=1 Tax=Streptomyces sp. AP-93 TaxID=2929048 RepID=UPI001FB02D50|nr:metalloprotease [Streptomyces sp. AP-93]MCJ0873902.1 metalloprotease [Streptomyces sp. AP-93]
MTAPLITPRRRGTGAIAAASLIGLLLTIPACAGKVEPRAQTCLSGTLTYDHKDADAGEKKPVVTSPARNANWELWGKTSAKASAERLASGITHSDNGTFKACYTAAGPLPEVHVKFRSSSTDMWRVVTDRTAQTEYAFDSPSRFDVSAGQNLGTVKVPAEIQNAWHVVDTLNLLYWKRGNPHSDCWTSHQKSGTCDRLTFVWEPADNADSGYWDHREETDTSEGANSVVVSGAMTDSKHLILHEAGHWWQWQLYGRQFPEVTDCSAHYIEKRSSTTCAWTEGFADAVAAYVLGDYRFVDENGGATSLENGTSTPGWDPGDTTQGRVGSSLLDLWAENGPDGGTWDRTIQLMTREKSDDFREYFLEDRPKATPPLSTTGAAKDILRRHTIDY